MLSNAVLLVDKPARWSSTDVVRQLKSALKYDKICFGAPLDTEATGLLIILLGRLAATAGCWCCWSLQWLNSRFVPQPWMHT